MWIKWIPMWIAAAVVPIMIQACGGGGTSSGVSSVGPCGVSSITQRTKAEKNTSGVATIQGNPNCGPTPAHVTITGLTLSPGTVNGPVQTDQNSGPPNITIDDLNLNINDLDNDPTP